MGNTTFIILGNYALVCAVATLFVLAGAALLEPWHRRFSRNTLLRIGAAYFAGMSLFTALYRSFAFASGRAFTGMAAALAALLLLACLPPSMRILKHAFGAARRHPFTTVVLLGAALTLQGYLFIFWMPPFLDPFPDMNAYQFLGSIHSGVYANIATYIVQQDAIPVFRMKYGQSLLATVPMLLGINRPYLALSLWLIVTNSIFVGMTYGLLAQLGVGRAMRFLGLAVVFLGNFALSLSHLWIVDLGTPILYLGYSDSIASLGTLVVFLFWIERYLRGGSPSLRSLLLPMVFGISWNLSSPEIFPTALTVLGAAVLFLLAARKRLLKPVLMTAAMGLGIVFGASLGGLLGAAPEKQPDIPGLLPVRSQRLGINVEFPYYVLKSYDRFQYDGEHWEALMLPFRTINDKMVRQETVVWNSLRIVFFPLVGAGVLAWLASKNAGSLRKRPLIGRFAAAACLVFAVGWFIVTFINFGAFGKWPMSRFLLSGYYLGLVSLVVALSAYARTKHPRMGRVFLLGIVPGFILLGPVIFSAHVLAGNLAAPDLKARIRLLTRLNGMVQLPPAP